MTSWALEISHLFSPLLKKKKPEQWTSLQFSLWNYPINFLIMSLNSNFFYFFLEIFFFLNLFFFFKSFFGASVLKQMILDVGTQLRNWVAARYLIEIKTDLGCGGDLMLYTFEFDHWLLLLLFLFCLCVLASPLGLQDLKFPDQGLNPEAELQQWKWGILTTGLPENSML